jgi:hypothetical protein
VATPAAPEGSTEETEAIAVSQSAPVAADQPAGEPLPEARPQPSDVAEPDPGAVPPPPQDDEVVAARFPDTMPGSAHAEEPPHLEEER